jgi:3-deoxy-D-manno-octulosonic-acid transferase
MQTDSDAAHLKLLGMDAGKVFVSGNVKFDARPAPVDDSLSKELRERFELPTDAPIILAASTHAPEERILIDALRRLSVSLKFKPRLMIAPRHPERFSEVASLLNASGFTWARRTAQQKTTDGKAQVILLDSIGELQSAYSLAPIVFVGGSIADTGGHNVLEPAATGAAVITGPHTYNFKSIVERFVDADAIVQLHSMTESETIAQLENAISDLLRDQGKRQALGDRAQALVARNRGATERTIDLLDSILHQRAAESDIPIFGVRNVPTV